MGKKFLTAIGILVILILLGIGSGTLGVKTDKLNFTLPQIANTLRITGPNTGPVPAGQSTTKVVSEESVTIDVVKKVSPAVVTVGITTAQSNLGNQNFGFGPFGFFQSPAPQNQQPVSQNIGSGFIIKSDGLIITNKHVVSDTTAKYRIVTADNKTYDVQKIYRDPNNDLAILKINATGLPSVELGDSSSLQVGQFAIAIGTALGEFRSTVTTGVISGIGRSITAGAPFQGSEQLNNIIQTSAAINPGNSGGPLLNSSGQVIGVNVATASDAQNIGFALPINTVKDSINIFETTGSFPQKAYLGVQYSMVSRNLAVINDIPEGAYIQNVVTDSPADKAGVHDGDIITKIDGQNIRDTNGGLSAVINKKKPGDSVELTIYRDTNETITIKVTLSESPS